MRTIGVALMATTLIVTGAFAADLAPGKAAGVQAASDDGRPPAQQIAQVNEHTAALIADQQKL